jgi:tRNA(fMet)-specific endonuclease VapC
MNGKLLVDTNIVIAAFAGEQAVVDLLHRSPAVCVPVITLGELYYGAWKSFRMDENLDRVDDLTKDFLPVSCDEETAKFYGRIKNQLRRDGRKIPSNDIWIAAIAMQHDLTLVTRDTHFQNVEDLSLEAW